MNENHLETACMDWLAESGYQCLTGDDVSLGGRFEARSKYVEVVLLPRLREAVVRLNPGVSHATFDEALAKVQLYAAQSLTEGNREFYGWIREGDAWRPKPCARSPARTEMPRLRCCPRLPGDAHRGNG